MITVRHSRLVNGLHALAVPDDGNVTITISSALDPADQRASVRTAMRAARRAGWLPSRVPGWLLLPLPWISLSGKVKALIAGASALALSTVVATLLVAAPPQPAGSVRIIPVRVAPSSSTVTVHRHRRRPVKVRTVRASTGKLAPSGVVAAPSPQVQVSAPLPAVSATASVSASLSPTPVPSASLSAGTCVYLLGIKVCLGL